MPVMIIGVCNLRVSGHWVKVCTYLRVTRCPRFPAIGITTVPIDVVLLEGRRATGFVDPAASVESHEVVR
jgi:hypothetical protein